MALVTMNEILPLARKEKRGIGAFNVGNYETTLAVMKAAEAEKSPVIIQVYKRLFESEKASDIAGMMIRVAQRSNQPIALHLDHGGSIDACAPAIEIGFSSVMIDASKLPFEENIKISKPIYAFTSLTGEMDS